MGNRIRDVALSVLMHPASDRSKNIDQDTRNHFVNNDDGCPKSTPGSVVVHNLAIDKYGDFKSTFV